MPPISNNLKFLLSLAKLQSRLARKFDGSLGGICQTEFMILYHLAEVRDEKMRRIDLADKIGLTASGVTRILLPMEKIGLVKKDVNKLDARISYVLLTPAGKRKLAEAMQDAEYLVEEILPKGHKVKAEEIAALNSLLN